MEPCGNRVAVSLSFFFSSFSISTVYRCRAKSCHATSPKLAGTAPKRSCGFQEQTRQPINWHKNALITASTNPSLIYPSVQSKGSIKLWIRVVFHSFPCFMWRGSSVASLPGQSQEFGQREYPKIIWWQGMWWACNQQLSHSATCRRMGAQTKESSHITQGFVFHILHKCRRRTWRTRVLATKLSHSLRQFPSWSAHPIAHSLRPVQGMLWTLHAVAPIVGILHIIQCIHIVDPKLRLYPMITPHVRQTYSNLKDPPHIGTAKISQYLWRLHCSRGETKRAERLLADYILALCHHHLSSNLHKYANVPENTCPTSKRTKAAKALYHLL